VPSALTLVETRDGELSITRESRASDAMAPPKKRTNVNARVPSRVKREQREQRERERERERRGRTGDIALIQEQLRRRDMQIHRPLD